MESHFPDSSIKANYQPKPNREGKPSWEAGQLQQAGAISPEIHKNYYLEGLLHILFSYVNWSIPNQVFLLFQRMRNVVRE